MTLSWNWKALMLIVVSVAILIAGIAYHNIEVKSFSPHADMKVPEAELPELIRKADAGDIKSMRRLFGYYAIYTGDQDAADRLSKRLADAGEREFQEAILSDLENSTSADDRAKAEVLSRKWNIKLDR